MADKAGDNAPRSANDKERSRQLSRPVSGKEAARGVNRPDRSQGRSQQGGGGKKQGQRQQGQRGPKQSGRGGRPPQGKSGGKGRGGRPSGQRSARGQRSGRSRTALFTWIAIGVVVVVVGVVVGVSQTSSTTPKNIHYTPEPVPATVLHEVTHVPESVFAKVGTGITGAVTPPRVVTGQPPLTYTGKPGMFGLFGNYCPYCAAERWAIISAFSRFGSFSGLRTMQSSPLDVFPATQTFAFNTATYVSPYFSAKLLEMYGQEKKTHSRPVINKPTKAESKLIAKYDVSSSGGSGTIPFLDFGNKLFTAGASYSPGPLQGLSRSTIAGSLKNPNSPITKLIIGAANYMSAAICSIDGGKPGHVCSGTGVKAAAKALGLSS